MPLGLKRIDLQTMAKEKLDDAILLLAHQRYSNAYYLGGYAAEMGLKACIAKTITAETIPDKKFIQDTFVHKLRDLIGVAGLTAELKNEEDGNAHFATNWALVSQWNPETRYGTVDAQTAKTMIEAINDPQSGVFQWINRYW
jgi:HEPN domain-containing protein